METKKILIYGSAKYGSIEQSYKRAFKELGNECDIIDINETDQQLKFYLSNRLLHRLTMKSYKLRRIGSQQWNYNVLDEVMNNAPDLFFVFKGNFLFPETIKKVKKNGIQVFVFNPDSPFNDNPNYRPEYLPLGEVSDKYFIWSKSIKNELERKDIKNVQYLPFAWDPKLHPFQSAEKKEYDVTFIGGWDERREKLLEEVAKNFKLSIWGPEYWGIRTHMNSWVRKVWMGEPVYGKKFSEVISKSKIVLNILREQNLPDGTNMRTFEAPGIGGFLLSNFTTGANKIYPNNEAGAYFQNLNDLLTQIERFLTNDIERERITKKAHKITTCNTYIDRAKQVLGNLE